MKISFVGLGKLGLPLATNFAKNNIDVLAIDFNENVINSLKNNIMPFYEVGLEDNISLAKNNIKYTTEYDAEICDTDITIFLVNTPSLPNGEFSNIYLKQSIASVCGQIKNKKTFHLFIISSTVMPNSIKGSFIPSIEFHTGWKLNKEFGVCYVPDFVALGNVIKDFEKPDFLLIGQSDPRSGDIAENLYSKIITNSAPIRKISLEEAEIAKISLNVYVCTKISFANFLLNLCDRIKNVNVDNITNVIGLDKRISPYYLKGGTSFGGTCFPRDIWAFKKLSETFGLDPCHINAAQEINEKQVDNVFLKVMELNVDAVSVLGLSFKMNSPVITESFSIKLIEKLLKRNIKVFVYDPLPDAIQNTKQIFGDDIEYISLSNCISNAKCKVIALPYKEFKIIEKSDFIIDCWRIL